MTEPVTLQEAKSHLRIDFSSDDDYIQALISVARDYAEGLQRRSIVSQTIELALNCFSPCIRLPRGPVQSIESVKYTQADGSVITIPSASYMLTSSDDVIPLPYGSSWPCGMLIPADGVKIRYQAGYEVVPPATKQALLLLIGHWYENREEVVIGKTALEMPMAAKSLLWLDRTW